MSEEIFWHVWALKLLLLPMVAIALVLFWRYTEWYVHIKAGEVEREKEDDKKVQELRKDD